MSMKCLINEENNIVKILYCKEIVSRYSKETKTQYLHKSSSSGRWTKHEHQEFVKALQKYGKDWSSLNAAIKGRTLIQIRTHAQKFFIKVAKLAPPGMEMIEFLRTKPVGFFVNFSDNSFQQEIEENGANLEDNGLCNEEEVPKEQDFSCPLPIKRTKKGKMKRKKHKHKSCASKKEESFQSGVKPIQEPVPQEVPFTPFIDPITESLKSMGEGLQMINCQLQMEISGRSKMNDIHPSLLESWNNLMMVSSCLHKNVCSLSYARIVPQT